MCLYVHIYININMINLAVTLQTESKRNDHTGFLDFIVYSSEAYP